MSISDIRFVLSEYAGKMISYSINMGTNRLETVNLYRADDCFGSADIGDIFVAKVINVVPGLNAAFIDYRKGQCGYLPFTGKYIPVLLNRNYDGRLKAGDELLVQLEKEAVRNKEPVFTMNLSLAGKYCVVTNGKKSRGVSKKCAASVREELLGLIPEEIDYGVIVRTNAMELVAEDGRLCPDAVAVTNECRQLSVQMDALLTDGVHRTCYSKIWQSPPPYLTALRDVHGINYSRLVTDRKELYAQLASFLDAYAPKLRERLVLYTDSYPLNKLYGIESKLEALLAQKVWLKSGAYLVIEKTEAMYVIDVNSGKNNNSKSKKADAAYLFSVNLEAAKEIMYQIRLRNLTGMILVDFINMDNDGDRERLMQELRFYARQDSILTTIVDMTALDIVEITRRKNCKSLAEQMREVPMNY